MKRFLKNILIFTPIALLAYVSLVIIAGSFPNSLSFVKKNVNYRIGSYGHMYTRLKEIKTVKNVDILFIGSSHAYRGFDPRIFNDAGYTSFNLGSSSQTYIQSLYLLKRHLDKVSPKLVVIEVFPGTLQSDGVESSLDILANDELDVDIIPVCLKTSNFKTYNTLIYSLYRQSLNLNDDFTESPVKGKDTYVQSGYVEKKMSYYKQQAPKNSKEKEWKVNDKQLEALEDIIELLNNKNIKYLLVQAPVSSAHFKSYKNQHEVDSIFSNQGTYINYNYNMNLDDSLYFYDAHHLNQEGVQLFNKKLIADIKQIIRPSE